MLVTFSRVRSTLAAVLLATTLAAGCGEIAGDDSAAGQFERELEAMAGVADARVEREAFDTEYWGEEIVVDMDGDATAEEVTAVLDAFLERDKETGHDPQDARLTIGAGTTDTVGDNFVPEAPPQAVPADRPAGNARVARLLVAAVAAFPGDFVSVTSDNWMLMTAAEGTDPRPEMDRMIDVIRADDLLATAEEFDLTVFAGPDHDRRLTSSAGGRLTPELVATWRDLAPRMEPRVFRWLSFGPTWIDIVVRAGEDVKPRQLTTEEYGDALWSTLHAALDTLVTLPRTATLTVANRYDVVDGAGGGHLEDRFLVTKPKLRTGKDRLGRTWNAEAAAYLDRLLARRTAG